MQNIEGGGADDIYYAVFQTIKHRGKRYYPRGKSCIEIRPMTVSIGAPESGIYTGVSRRLNYSFWAIETLCYMAGIEPHLHALLVCASNKNMAMTLNPLTNVFDGNYCTAFNKGLPRVYDELSKDPQSRRAIISLWSIDQDMSSLDIPCTTTIQFMADRFMDAGDMFLSVSTYMRSNDINWGLPYDMGAFCALQMLMAGALDWDYGWYHHTTGSMHYYEVGNDQGEKPPMIASPDDELWISDVVSLQDVEMPEPPHSFDIREAMRGAEHLLIDLATHLNEGGKLSAFRYSPPPGRLQAYFSQWASLISWTWKAGGM